MSATSGLHKLVFWCGAPCADVGTRILVQPAPTYLRTKSAVSTKSAAGCAMSQNKCSNGLGSGHRAAYGRPHHGPPMGTARSRSPAGPQVSTPRSLNPRPPMLSPTAKASGGSNASLDANSTAPIRTPSSIRRITSRMRASRLARRRMPAGWAGISLRTATTLAPPRIGVAHRVSRPSPQHMRGRHKPQQTIEWPRPVSAATQTHHITKLRSRQGSWWIKGDLCANAYQSGSNKLPTNTNSRRPSNCKELSESNRFA